MKRKNIPFSGQDIVRQDLENVVSVIKSGWLAHGEYSEKLESLFCSFTGAKYATTVSNCNWVDLSCLAAGFKTGDEVIILSDHTATACCRIYWSNAVFADIDLISGNILVSEIEKG